MPNALGFVPVVHAATNDSPDEIDTLVTAEAVAAALARLGYETEICPIGLDLSVLQNLAARRPIAVFNMVEAMHGDDRLVGIVPAVLEHFGLAFTGGDSAAISLALSKCRTKKLLKAAGLPTPDWSGDGSDCRQDTRYIIKADMYHGSVGMDADSVVAGSDVTAEIARRNKRYGIEFFAEQYIEGREFNVALADGPDGVQLLPIQEIIFEGFQDNQLRIVDYAAKWDPDSEAYLSTPRRFGIESREPALAHLLGEISLALWRGLSLNGYGRVDFRVDEQGRPFVLEVNINPAIAPDAGMIAAADQSGIGYDAFIATLVAGAIARQRVIDTIRNKNNA